MKVDPISTHIFHPNWRALCYVVENNKVLLGLKKEGFGKNLRTATGSHTFSPANSSPPPSGLTKKTNSPATNSSPQLYYPRAAAASDNKG